LYVGLKLDYKLRPWTLTCSSRAISAVAELIFTYLNDDKRQFYPNQTKTRRARPRPKPLPQNQDLRSRPFQPEQDNAVFAGLRPVL